MIAAHHVISVPLIAPDADAAIKLRAALKEMRGFNKTFSVEIGPLNEVILHADSELRLEQIVDYSKRGLGLDFTAGAPQVAYREAITQPVEWDYTHKRLTPPQYAKLKIRFAPGEPGSGFRFDSKAGDDAVPPVFISAVLKGLQEAARRGPADIAPVTDLACTLLGGDYHEVDSTRDTFEIAARACLREALPKARPVILEPMMAVVVVTPQDYMGDVIGDLNSRRGMVTGMQRVGELEAISALVPFANLFGYFSGFQIMTQGRAEYAMAFSHYQQVPHGPPPGDGPFAPAAALRG
jgi:elongation factor G